MFTKCSLTLFMFTNIYRSRYVNKKTNEMYTPNTNSIVHLFGGGQCFIQTESRDAILHD